MKRIIGILLMIACGLACGMFAGCDLIEDIVNPEDDAPLYELIYTSNGDGTCYVSNILTRPDIMQSYTVEIPETSPDGDTVVGVEVTLSDMVYRNVPYMFLAEDFEALCETAKANGMHDFDYARMTSCYLKISITGLDEQSKAEVIECFPMTAYADIYVVDSSIYTSVEDVQKLSRDFAEYAGFDEQKRYEVDCKLLKVQSENDPNDVYDAGWHYTAYMDKLVLPATVKTVLMPPSTFVEITFAGTTAQWAEVRYEFKLLSDSKVVCSDGELPLTSDLN